jgi:hypothetical protein
LVNILLQKIVGKDFFIERPEEEVVPVVPEPVFHGLPGFVLHFKYLHMEVVNFLGLLEGHSFGEDDPVRTGLEFI